MGYRYEIIRPDVVVVFVVRDTWLFLNLGVLTTFAVTTIPTFTATTTSVMRGVPFVFAFWTLVFTFFGLLDVDHERTVMFQEASTTAIATTTISIA